jgi:hypothetical protein
MVARLRRANWLRWLIGTDLAQRFMKRRIERTVKGPSAAKRDVSPITLFDGLASTAIDGRASQFPFPQAVGRSESGTGKSTRERRWHGDRRGCRSQPPARRYPASVLTMRSAAESAARR